jgi:hypothetical protein
MQQMVRRALIVLCVGLMTILLANCGQTYELVSISVSPAAGYSLTNAAPQGALTVTANYSNSKTADVTMKSSYEILASSLDSTTAPLNVAGVPTVTVNNSGVVTANAAAPACTWSATTPPQPSPYQVQVSYTDNGVTARALVSINVATSAGCVSQ